MTIATGSGAIPQLCKAIAHWKYEIANTRVALGISGPHTKAQRRYVAECKGFIRRLSREIHDLRNPKVIA